MNNTTNTNLDKIIDKVGKLFALADGNNNSEYQAEQAILKAQELMAKHGITVEQLADTDSSKVEYDFMAAKHRDNSSFRSPLCSIIADNFRCIAYLKGGKQVVFFGHKQDVFIATKTFEFAYRWVKREGEKRIKYHREQYGHARGVFNSYAFGFMVGLKKKLEAQCQALVLVVPQDVKDEFSQLVTLKNKDQGSWTNNNTIAEEYHLGYADGQRCLDSDKLNAAKQAARLPR